MPHLERSATAARLTRLAAHRSYAWVMGLTMRERRAVTVVKARAYARADRAKKGRILGKLMELTRWPRDYARRALRQALRPREVRPRTGVLVSARSSSSVGDEVGVDASRGSSRSGGVPVLAAVKPGRSGCGRWVS